MSNLRPRSDAPDDSYEIYAIPRSTLARHEHHHALLDDVHHTEVINYQLLRDLPDGSWLISVRGRVYELKEETIEAGIDALSDQAEPFGT